MTTITASRFEDHAGWSTFSVSPLGIRRVKRDKSMKAEQLGAALNGLLSQHLP